MPEIKTYYGIRMIPKKPTLTRTTANKINKLSRAINKMDARLMNKLISYDIVIEDIKPGVNTVKYRENGVAKEIRYDELEKLPESRQAPLLRQMRIDRYELRNRRALEQVQVKGKVSGQFKKSIKKDNPTLYDSILKFEEETQDNKSDTIRKEFKNFKINYDTWEKESDDYFNDPKVGTPELFDFYYNLGFEKLNAFSWNVYKALRGI